MPVYTSEAYALDIENCRFNVPTCPLPGRMGSMSCSWTYQDRLDAAVVQDFMTPEADLGWQWPFDDLLIDGPNNIIYEHFFLRPAGIVVINCDGIVTARGDWLGNYIANPKPS